MNLNTVITNDIQNAMAEKHLMELVKILKTYLPEGVNVFLYGSRSKGTHSRFSDVDLALKGDVSFKQLAILSLELEESNLPFFVDVHRIKDLDPEFLKMIEGDFLELNF